VHDATVILKHFAMSVSGDKDLMVGLGPFLATFVGHQGGQVGQVTSLPWVAPISVLSQT